MDYDGGRTRSDIVSRAMDLFSDNAPPPELLEVSGQARGEGCLRLAGGGGRPLQKELFSRILSKCFWN